MTVSKLVLDSTPMLTEPQTSIHIPVQQVSGVWPEHRAVTLILARKRLSDKGQWPQFRVIVVLVLLRIIVHQIQLNHLSVPKATIVLKIQKFLFHAHERHSDLVQVFHP